MGFPFLFKGNKSEGTALAPVTSKVSSRLPRGSERRRAHGSDRRDRSTQQATPSSPAPARQPVLPSQRERQSCEH